MQILVVVLLSQEVETEAKRISLKYHPQLYADKELPPHITLIPPTNLTGQLADIEEVIESAVRDQSDFAINISGIGYFTKRNNVVYLAVERSGQLENLLKEVSQSISPFIANDSSIKLPFQPHITLAKKLDSNRQNQILKELKDYRPKFTFPFQSLGLFTLDEKEMFWRLKKNLNLNSLGILNEDFSKPF